MVVAELGRTAALFGPARGAAIAVAVPGDIPLLLCSSDRPAMLVAEVSRVASLFGAAGGAPMLIAEVRGLCRRQSSAACVHQGRDQHSLPGMLTPILQLHVTTSKLCLGCHGLQRLGMPSRPCQSPSYVGHQGGVAGFVGGGVASGVVRLCNPSSTIQPKLVRSNSRLGAGGRDVGTGDGLTSAMTVSDAVVDWSGAGWASADASPAKRTAIHRRRPHMLPSLQACCLMPMKCPKA